MPKAKTWITEDGRLAFWCPGCEEVHAVPIDRPWRWNGDRERPTLTPSMLITSGHFNPGHKGECWCTYNAKHEDPAPFKCGRCHTFLTDGRIQFLGDCTHKLAGVTVALEEF